MAGSPLPEHEQQAGWPSASAVFAAAAGRLEQHLAGRGPLLVDVARALFGSENRLLSPLPHSLGAVVVAGACLSAGGDWRQAAWPAVGLECAMAAADLLDDLADADLPPLGDHPPAVLLTAAAGLLALAGEAVLRAVDDGVPASTCVALGRILGAGFAEATDGQARSLQPRATSLDALGAFELAAGKSGPLGALAAQLGARVATDTVDLLDAYTRFGWHVALFSQLTNDARDAAPGGSLRKADVRTGQPTVPLRFVRSAGAPPGLSGEALAEWERAERERVQAGGGIAAAYALAEAERLHALAVLDDLVVQGRPVAGLRALLY